MKRSIAVAIRFLCAIIPGFSVLVLTIIMLKHGEKPSVEMLLNHMPHSGWTATVVLWGIFALKSLSIVFPLALLFAVSGVLYPLPQAILVNLIG